MTVKYDDRRHLHGEHRFEVILTGAEMDNVRGDVAKAVFDVIIAESTKVLLDDKEYIGFLVTEKMKNEIVSLKKRVKQLEAETFYIRG